jgi:hypothetical protein
MVRVESETVAKGETAEVKREIGGLIKVIEW